MDDYGIGGMLTGARAAIQDINSMDANKRANIESQQRQALFQPQHQAALQTIDMNKQALEQNAIALKQASIQLEEIKNRQAWEQTPVDLNIHKATQGWSETQLDDYKKTLEGLGVKPTENGMYKRIDLMRADNEEPVFKKRNQIVADVSRNKYMQSRFDLENAQKKLEKIDKSNPVDFNKQAQEVKKLQEQEELNRKEYENVAIDSTRRDIEFEKNKRIQKLKNSGLLNKLSPRESAALMYIIQSSSPESVDKAIIEFLKQGNKLDVVRERNEGRRGGGKLTDKQQLFKSYQDKGGDLPYDKWSIDYEKQKSQARKGGGLSGIQSAQKEPQKPKQSGTPVTIYGVTVGY